MNEVQRDPWLDNAKFFLIFLVVFGHLIEPFNKHNVFIQLLWQSIYTLHMPAFIFISGYLFAEDDSNVFEKNILSLLIPLVTLDIAYELFHIILNGSVSGYAKHLAPYWILWFLLSMFFWRIVFPYLIKFRILLGGAALLSVVIGLVNSAGYPLSLSRTIYFFPFFILGNLSKKKEVLNHSIFKSKNMFLFFFLWFSCLYITLYCLALPDAAFLGSTSYHKMSLGMAQGAVYRLVLMILSGISIVLLLVATPKKNYGFTIFGKRSLHIYLLHGFVIRLIEKFDFRMTLLDKPFLLLTLNLVTSATIILVLGSSAMSNQFSRVFSRGDKLNKEKANI